MNLHFMFIAIKLCLVQFNHLREIRIILKACQQSQCQQRSAVDHDTINEQPHSKANQTEAVWSFAV